jgi:hypothetical protein
MRLSSSSLEMASAKICCSVRSENRRMVCDQSGAEFAVGCGLQ